MANCKDCGLPPKAHFKNGRLQPPPGCKAVERYNLRTKAKAWLKKGDELARKRYYALPGAATAERKPGSKIAAVLQVIVDAGAEGITPNRILTHVVRHGVTDSMLANYLSKLRSLGAVASAPIK